MIYSGQLTEAESVLRRALQLGRQQLNEGEEQELDVVDEGEEKMCIRDRTNTNTNPIQPIGLDELNEVPAFDISKRRRTASQDGDMLFSDNGFNPVSYTHLLY